MLIIVVFVIAYWKYFAFAFGVVVICAVAHWRRARQKAELQRAQQMRLDRHVAAADGMSGTEFEELVVRLLRKEGCRDARRSGGAGDLGADVVASAPDGRKLVVQCKRFRATSKVGSPDMQRFAGTVRQVHNADIALFVTTARFTAPAEKLANQCDIELVDRDRLAEWMTSVRPLFVPSR